MSSRPRATTIRELLGRGRTALAEVSESPRLDAELLLAATLGWNRSRLFAWPEWIPTAAEARRFRRWLARRREGQPVAYLLGRREFWGLDLTVTEATLIPRPETERLVELALARIDVDDAVDVADLGTGSGAVALAIGRERPRSHIIASDVSDGALEIARDNARRLAIANVEFCISDWLAGFPQHRLLDMVVSNPPYVADNDPALAALCCEPRSALVAGRDGLAAIRRIVAEAPRRLRSGGWILLEHGAGQGAAVAQLLKGFGYRSVRTERDLAGLDRVSLARMPRHAPPRGSARTNRQCGPRRR